MEESSADRQLPAKQVSILVHFSTATVTHKKEKTRNIGDISAVKVTIYTNHGQKKKKKDFIY